jgi:hypothetical protein
MSLAGDFTRRTRHGGGRGRGDLTRHELNGLVLATEEITFKSELAGSLRVAGSDLIS